MGSNSKGSRKERELVQLLDDRNFATMRAPASGGGTRRRLPDILTGNGDAFYALEVKNSAGDPIYFPVRESAALEYFAANFGAVPRIGVRFDREDWYFFAPEELYVTDGLQYRIKKETALSDGTTLSELTK